MKKNIKIVILLIGVFLLSILFSSLNLYTGLLDYKINEKNSDYWKYRQDLFEENSKSIELQGNKEVCWLMLHGYTAVPGDYSELSKKVNDELEDYVYVPLLKGHGTNPEDLINLTLEDWYLQVEEDFDRLNSECNNVNVVGFSVGGTLALKLAEQKEVNNLYLISPYLFPKFGLNFLINSFGNYFVYVEKNGPGKINDPLAEEKYVSYLDFPLEPVKNSAYFFNDVRDNLFLIEKNILIQHSKKDDTANYAGSLQIFENVNSSVKKIILFEKSNHVLLKDYDGEEAIQNIIDFEKKNRV